MFSPLTLLCLEGNYKHCKSYKFSSLFRTGIPQSITDPSPLFQKQLNMVENNVNTPLRYLKYAVRYQVPSHTSSVRGKKAPEASVSAVSAQKKTPTNGEMTSCFISSQQTSYHIAATDISSTSFNSLEIHKETAPFVSSMQSTTAFSSALLSLAAKHAVSQGTEKKKS